jgi:AGZA family xanthine/uracil permease-like MFS transporter
MVRKLDAFFGVREWKSSFKRETAAGVTTFMAMAYIVFVNPAILSAAFKSPEVPNEVMFKALVTATCLASAVGTFLMAFIARYPIALAPGMGLNAILVYNICLQKGVPWKIGLGIVFISGVVFMVLSVVRIREMIIDAIPRGLKFSAAVGIGMFITFIGLKHAGIIVVSGQTFVQLGDLTSRPVLVSLAGLAITAIVYTRGIKGAVLLGIAATGVIAWYAGLIHLQGKWFELPTFRPLFGKLDVAGALKVEYFAPILVLLFFHMFDSVGTLIGVGEQGGFLKEGKLPRATQALFADATAATFGAVAGTSTVTCYIESSAGIADGGRTGFANLVTGLLFIAAMFFSPLAEMVGVGLPQTFTVIFNGQPIQFTDKLFPVTAPALVVVGGLMMQSVKDIKWTDWTEAMPAFLTIILMPLTFSISTGLFAGLVAYPVLKIAAGRGREVHWLLYTLVVVFLVALVGYLR